MNKIRLTQTQHALFKEAWEIYQEAFPEAEKRSLPEQSTIMEDDRYHFEIIQINDAVVGFFLWWHLSDIIYIDHLAVHSAWRNQQLGQKIMKDFLLEANKPILLEVDPPQTIVDHRRISFYEKLGFVMNNHQYYLPLHATHGMETRLDVMTFPEVITEQELATFVNQWHPVLFPQQPTEGI